MLTNDVVSVDQLAPVLQHAHSHTAVNVSSSKTPAGTNSFIHTSKHVYYNWMHSKQPIPT